MPFPPPILLRAAQRHPSVEKFAGSVEDAKALRSRVARPVHVPPKLKCLAEVSEPARVLIGDATGARLVVAQRNEFDCVVRHRSSPALGQPYAKAALFGRGMRVLLRFVGGPPRP